MRYQPMQPIETDEHGVRRFRDNALVRYLLDNGGIDMNRLAVEDFPREDRDQFKQLIGYSVSAAPISSDLQNSADLAAEKDLPPEQARIEFLEGEIRRIRDSLRGPVSEIFNLHPDDLQ